MATAAQTIEEHVAHIDLCNQRGGRMLSVVDLIEAGTLTREEAAYLTAAIASGASFLVGARPRGAGKTTVMGALLNWVPREVHLATAEDLPAIERGLHESSPRRCYIAHEIGPGPYYAYLWGEPLRRYFELPGAGQLVASNLHADTVAEMREQICEINRVSEALFCRIDLLIFLRVRMGPRGPLRRVVEVWEADGDGGHRCIWKEGRAQGGPESHLVPPDRMRRHMEILDALEKSGARTIGEVRRFVLQSPPPGDPSVPADDRCP